MQHITEETKVHEGWYEEADKMTLEDLPEFLSRLLTEYGHDYGTICHALAAGAVATLHAMNKHENAGITGFQAGAIMWEFIRHWNYSNNKTGMRLMDWDNLLYPQYEDHFQKTISADTWAALQEEAAANIKEADEEYEQYRKDMVKYEKDIAAFAEKYPDYHDDPGKYEHLVSGTEEDLIAYREKEKSGFEFAPRKPHYGPYSDSVYGHWKNIVDGVVPFGYVVREED